MFWFLAFVVVLVLFLKQRSQFDKEKKDSYQRGRNDERLLIEENDKKIVKDNQAQSISFAAPVTTTTPAVSSAPPEIPVPASSLFT